MIGIPFQKGMIPWNKGLKTGIVPKTAFKKGNKAERPFGKDHPAYCYWLGKNRSEETKKKISLSKKGKPSPNYRGGLTPKNLLERSKFRDTMQKEVFKRDNYTCQLCGSKNDLQVDHIQSWSEYVELRFEMKNCRTLCSNCHYEITYGRPKPIYIKAWGHNLKYILERGCLK